MIIGASSEIGKETAKLFAKEGALVILTARNMNNLKVVENELIKNGEKAESYSCSERC